jgi:hypothetical protein
LALFLRIIAIGGFAGIFGSLLIILTGDMKSFKTVEFFYGILINYIMFHETYNRSQRITIGFWNDKARCYFSFFYLIGIAIKRNWIKGIISSLALASSVIFSSILMAFVILACCKIFGQI